MAMGGSLLDEAVECAAEHDVRVWLSDGRHGLDEDAGHRVAGVAERGRGLPGEGGQGWEGWCRVVPARAVAAVSQRLA